VSIHNQSRQAAIANFWRDRFIQAHAQEDAIFSMMRVEFAVARAGVSKPAALPVLNEIALNRRTRQPNAVDNVFIKFLARVEQAGL
jgi:hypothetical protein